jgi:hypothetical protein
MKLPNVAKVLTSASKARKILHLFPYMMRKKNENSMYTTAHRISYYYIMSLSFTIGAHWIIHKPAERSTLCYRHFSLPLLPSIVSFLAQNNVARSRRESLNEVMCSGEANFVWESKMGFWKQYYEFSVSSLCHKFKDAKVNGKCAR